MLSILIPVYNFNVTSFITKLHEQSLHANIKFEIILADDASDTEFRKLNQELSNLPGITYIQLDKNIGRSKIRNFLSEKAKYNYLFFADCDSQTHDDQFIKKYTDLLKGELIICGGRNYSESRPKIKSEYLRWLYGVKRETKTAEERSLNPNRSFMTNNYIISKKIHNEVMFDENLSQYGHEDTLFGIELKRKGYQITHTNNPLEHIGLEPDYEFINKTEKGIENLAYIIKNYNYPELFTDIKLLSTFNKTKYLSLIFRIILRLLRNPIISQLKSNRPSLRLFDLYKLSYLHKMMKRQIN